jgi:hypothetical protein
MKTAYTTSITEPADMRQRRAWVDRFFASASELPIAFVLDGEPITETVFEGIVPKSGDKARFDIQIDSYAYPGNKQCATLLTTYCSLVQGGNHGCPRIEST